MHSVGVLSIGLTLLVCLQPNGRVGYSQCLTYDDSRSLQSTTDLSMILEFELNLFKMLLPPLDTLSTSLVMSPYTVWNALVLAYFGSAGETERQMMLTLGLDDKITTLKKWRRLQYLYDNRPETTINNTFVLANKIYFDNDLYPVLRPCMGDLLHNEVELIDFAYPRAAAARINSFVADVTEGTIPGLVNPNDVHNAQMVLVNAAYFKGVWQTPFDVIDTRPRPFRKPDGSEVYVETMMTKGEFRLGYDDELGVELLELPYDGKVLSMLIFLPYEPSMVNMAIFFHKLTPASFMRLIDSTYSEIPFMIDVFLPKFTIETSAGNELIEALTVMGLTAPFDPRVANFSYFAPYTAMSLDRSIHKSFIQINEEGTEASSATAFISVKIQGSTMRCDRSFAFAIRDNETKNILFIGIYNGPSEGEEVLSAPQPAGPLTGFEDIVQVRT